MARGPLLLVILCAAAAAHRGQAAKPGQADLYSYWRLKGRQTILFEQWTAEQNKKNGTTLHPATVYASLTPSQRSTYEAVTHALSRSRLTAEGGQRLRASALELVEGIDEIAGQVKGARRPPVPPLRPARSRHPGHPDQVARVLPRQGQHGLPQGLPEQLPPARAGADDPDLYH